MTNLDPLHIREATSYDQEFLDRMNVVASYGPTRPESKLPSASEFFELHPENAVFSEDFGRGANDIGLIAENADGEPLGAIWGREYERSIEDGPMHDHPFEVVLAVSEKARMRGIGRRLLKSFAVTATAHNVEEIALGVHIKSPIRKLYESAGYAPLIAEDGSEALIGDGHYVPMVRKLGSRQD